MTEIEAKVDQLLAGMDSVRQTLAVHTETHRQIDRDLGGLLNEVYGSGPVAGIKTRLISQIDTCAAIQSGKKPASLWQEFFFKIGSNVASAAIIGFMFWLLMIYEKVKP